MKKITITEEMKIAASEAFKEKEYWLNKMSGEPGISYFPFDFEVDGNKEEEVPEVPGDCITFAFTGELFSRFLTLSNRSDTRLFMILAAGLAVLLNKYTGNIDIIAAAPIKRQESEDRFINTVLPLRTVLGEKMSFKELLLEFRTTFNEALEHQNYPLEVLMNELQMDFEGGQPVLFDTAILLENLQDRKYIRHLHLNTVFSFQRKEESIEGVVEYNPRLYEKGTIERIIAHFTRVFAETLFNIDIEIAGIDILSEAEKQQLLVDFNRTGVDYGNERRIHQLFAAQVEKTPDNTALIYNLDLSHIKKDLPNEEISVSLLKEYERCCFKKNPYVYRFTDLSVLGEFDILDWEEIPGTVLLQTHRRNYVVMNRPTYLLLDCFDGASNLASVFRGITADSFGFTLGSLVSSGDTGIPVLEKKEILFTRRFEDVILLVKELYKTNLIDLSGYTRELLQVDFCLEENRPVQWSDHGEEINERAGDTAVGEHPVLLLGDTTGPATTGLLYIASYLRRKGIEAYCQWNDFNRTGVLLRKNIRDLLAKINPGIVGISMKWFPHIARVLETCKIIKEYDPSIRLVLGGNTASYYKKELIRYEWIDYIVVGDGELPFLEICLGKDDIPNCIYKRNGEIIETPITYIQDASNSDDIYLSHLPGIFVSKIEPYLVDAFYINTGKGCSRDCLYCGGNREVQQRSFGRLNPFLRNEKAVQRDILEVKNYISTFMFDFDLPLYDSGDYYEKIWENIDLSGHFCEFYFWKLPTKEFIDLVSGRFKYVYLNIDLCSLSEEHRRKLSGLKKVKPQPMDEELISFFDTCGEYDNVEVRISLIAGLPYFSFADFKRSERFLEKLLREYPFFSGLDWGRLHAQPGADISLNSEEYHMTSRAKTFEEFLHYSRLNLKPAEYPGLADIEYPFVYYNDDELNSGVSKHFYDTNVKVDRDEERKRNRLSLPLGLTYRQLNQEANWLASGLRKKGVKPDSIVGLVFERSLEMITAIFGVLKAGGAYLPIDPAYPEDRITFMLRDSGVKLVLTNCREKISMDMPEGIELIDIKEDNGHRHEDTSNPDNVNKAADLIYVIYTSGSTGRPRGVPVEHRGVENMLLYRKGAYRLGVEDTSLQLFSYAFDGFVTSFFTPILSGSRVVLLNDNEILDIYKIISAVVENRVTHFISVPQLYREIIENLSGEESRFLKVVTLAGDRLPADIVEISNQTNENIEIAHEYGVTEASVMSTILRNQEKHGRISIGKPVGNTMVLILDPRGKLQPIGVSGELCIGGNSLARGYLNQPELTAKKYRSYRTNRTYSLHFSKKIYRTGDLARWLPDGNIEFRGRMDNQVKVRAFRIELGEIENRLLKHRHIREAVVLVKQDNRGSEFLCAYVAKRAGEDELNIAEIKEYLSKTLPAYMIPSYFIEIEGLPLTPNGKIDRKALSKYDENIRVESDYVPPRSQLEQRLTEIWQGELNADRVGIRDNYFNIGGDSIKAIRLVNKVNTNLEQELQVVDLYVNNTVEKLAEKINQTRAHTVSSIDEEDKETEDELKRMKEEFLKGMMDQGHG